MGQALAQTFAPARAVFDEVDAALGERLTAVMWQGPAETLTLTENAQPALMAVSLAVLRVLEAEAGIDLARDVQCVAGHSLGEYSALAAAGALSISDTARTPAHPRPRDAGGSSRGGWRDGRRARAFL